MATVLLSAAGAAIGGSIGGTVAGLSTAVIGRAVGATLGRVIDQRLMGQGSQTVETGRVDRFRLSNAGEGEPVSQIYGQMRVGGQVIWASDFLESTSSSTTGGGKGVGASQPKTTKVTSSYSVNLALALCEGVITRVGRVWADGEEVPLSALNMRVYTGGDAQLPDPLIEAIEGAGQVPAYRGTAYVIFENLQLEQFGNRVPQFSFEISRPDQPDTPETLDLARAIKAVALMPGTGEYALATTPVHYSNGPTSKWSANVNSPAGRPDFSVSFDMLRQELPNSQAASLIVSWFGGDLRCAQCQIRPKVEQTQFDGENMPWTVAGLPRAAAQVIAQIDGKPIYGGTPSDQSVIESIQAMTAAGKAVMFYPFILMDQLAGSGLPDPYGGLEQARLPWRGRITTNIAAGRAGTTDGTAGADAEVQAFFGTARASDFTWGPGWVNYSGPQEWSFSRFILHYAALCSAAGGVESFCIGSELRGLTWIRGAGNTFPFVQRLIQLTNDVRTLVGWGTKISYAADWSEYFGYQPPGTNDRIFHLDPLWAQPNIDFIGIDNYMPLSDWRDGEVHADAEAGSIYDLDYLRSNIEGGEGYDWYYANEFEAAAQARTPITDGAHGEPWIYRYKDIRNWWANPHHDRINGVRQPTPTGWQPQSKPVWFTEYGCAAIDKATNQPNKFLDPKSSESLLPKYSNGQRDDLIQMQYIRAMNSFYAEPANNPVSAVYGGPMIDMNRAFLWAWDARPYPYFPNNIGLWSDGGNYARGHWINGRTSARPLSSVVKEICAKAGLTQVDTSKLYGYVRGYVVPDVATARQALQPLMLRYGFDAVERDGTLNFVMRQGQIPRSLDFDALARSEDIEGVTEQDRDPELEMSGRVRLQFVQSDADFEIIAEEAVLPDQATHAVSTSEVPLSLTRGEGRQTVERWLSEARVARDRLRFALPPSLFDVGAGDVITLPGENGEEAVRYRVDRVEQGPHQIVEAVRTENAVYTSADVAETPPPVKPFVPPLPVAGLFLDLPLLRGDEVAHAPYFAAGSDNWPGAVALYRSMTDSDYALNTVASTPSVMGLTRTALPRAVHGIWDRAGAIEVALGAVGLQSVTDAAIFAGANTAVIGDGTPGNWEIIQFRDVTLVEAGVYRLSMLLRGQQGSDALMPDTWPTGSWFVLMNGAAEQIDMASNLRGVTQYFRWGSARLPLDNASYSASSATFAGNGLRPFAPTHLRATPNAGGDLSLEWIRRSRVDGDNWEGEVPLGEDTEAYRVRISKDGSILREVETTTAEWIYPQALQVSDGAVGQIEIDVAQISARFGAGPTTVLQTTV